jgi:hypothetical protein
MNRPSHPEGALSTHASSQLTEKLRKTAFRLREGPVAWASSEVTTPTGRE